MNRLLHKFAQFAVWLIHKGCTCAKCEGWRKADAHKKKYPEYRTSGYLKIIEPTSTVEQSIGTFDGNTNYTYTWFTPSSSAEGKTESKKTRKASVANKNKGNGRVGGKKRKSS